LLQCAKDAVYITQANAVAEVGALAPQVRLKLDNPKALLRNQNRVINLFEEKSLHDEDSISPRYKFKSPGFITLGFRYDEPKDFEN